MIIKINESTKICEVFDLEISNKLTTLRNHTKNT